MTENQSSTSKQPLQSKLAQPSFLKMGISLFVVIAVVGLIGFLNQFPKTASSENSEAQSVKALTVEVDPVSFSSEYEQPIRFIGRVEAKRESQLGFELAGVIKKVHVDEGDKVIAKQTLAELDVEKLNARKKVLNAQKKSAKAMLDELVAGPRKEQIKRQQAEVDRLASELERLELSKKRHEQLRKNETISDQEYETVFFNAKSAKSAHDSASAVLEELVKGTRKEKVDAQNAKFLQLEAEIESLEVDIRKSKIEAPFEGVIAMRFSDEGRVVSPGQSIISLLEISKPQVRVGVDSKTADLLKIGQSINVSIDAYTQSAKIISIRRDLSQRTRTVDILLTVSNKPYELKSGDLAKIEINRTIYQEGFWVPIEALTEGNRGLWSLYIAKPNDKEAKTDDESTHSLERRDVELHYTTADKAFVYGVLEHGDLVVQSGTHRLIPKLPVRLESREN